MTTPSEIVDTFIGRVCAKDLDGACELVADDIEYDNVPLGKQFGPQGIKDLLGPMIDGMGRVEFVVHRQAATGNVVINERTDRFEVGDRWIELPVAGVFEVGGDGRLTLWRDYFDLDTFNQHLAAATGS